MKKHNKRLLSLLLALTMLIGMVTAVAVSAATEEWLLVKELDFEGENPLADLSQNKTDADKAFEVVVDPTTGSMAAHITRLGEPTVDENDLITNYKTIRMFNVLGYAVSANDEFKIEFDARVDNLNANNKNYYNNGSPYDFRFITSAVTDGVGATMNFANQQVKATGKTFTPASKAMPANTTTKSDGQIYFTFNNVAPGEEIWIDNIKLYKKNTPAAPVVEGDVTISGAAQLGQTLTATAVVSDANREDTATASYQWQVKIDDTWKDISGATTNTYVIGETATVDGAPIALLGKQLRVKVTPTSDNAPLTGTPVESEPTQAIIEATIPPSGTGEKIDGTFEVGQELIASFEYVPSASNVEKGNAEYIWETSSSEAFAEGLVTEVQKGTDNKYIIKLGDVGKWLRVRIIPKDKNGLAGQEIVVDATKVEGTVSFYVSINDGDDSNAGSKDKPFKTIQKARDTIRELKGDLPNGGITVNIMGGTYTASDTITFTAEDSGTEDAPIVYQAYNNEKVSFIGGEVLNSSKIKKVTDEKVLDGLVEEDAKDHLYMLDLEEQGIEMDALQPYGDGHRRETTGYRPKRVYMNNQLLTDARWPNEDQSQNLVAATPVTKEQNADVAAGKYNAASTPIMYGYPDSENRSAKWDIEEGDAYVGGAVVYYWAPTYLRIKDIDTEKKIVTSMDKSSYGSVSDAGWGGQCKIFFSNIFAEIDKPGESYVDRKNNILYFYPIGSVENAEMVVSTLKKDMISMNGVSYVSFKGIDFKNTVEAAVALKDCDNVTIADAEIANITQAAMKMTNCTDTVIEGNNFYNIGSSAIDIVGDDAVLTAPTAAEKLTTIPENRKTLTPSGNEIRYNNFHNICIFANHRNTAVDIQYAVGEWIHHNEFNDIDLYTIRMQESNDTLIEYNKFLNLGELNSDAGAINWGRELDSLGHTVRYNYFENIGSKLVSNHLLGHQSVSIFIDDASTGGEIYGNIFLNGGSNQSGVGSPTVGNGPEFTNVWGNISICTDFDRMQYTFRMRNWGDLEGTKQQYGTTVPKGTAASTWLYQMQMREPYQGSISNMTKQSDKDMMWSDEWAARYENTLWAGAIDHYSKENYEGAKALFDKQDYVGVLKFLGENLIHERTNKVHNNVSLGAIEEHTDTAGNYDGTNYYGTQHAITEEDKALFVDFDNKDFTLTDAGLAKIKAKAPKFEAIPFNEIGLGDKAVGGHKPKVTINPEIVTGAATAGSTITASYSFSDADGDLEGGSKIYWYVGNSANGKFDMIWGHEGANFDVTEEYSGRYLKYEVVPFDTSSLRGESVMSGVISVRKSGNVDFSVLSKTITEATKLLNNAVVGTEAGQYPEKSVEEFRAAITEANNVANDSDSHQFLVNQTVEILKNAIDTFNSRVISNKVSMFINPLLVGENREKWVDALGNDEIEFTDDGSMILSSGGNGTAAVYTGDIPLNTEITFKMKAEPLDESKDYSDGWIGIYFRQDIKDNWGWAGTCAMFDLKQDLIQYQQYVNKTGGKINELIRNDKKFVMGQEHLVTVGVYDGHEVSISLSIDGEKIYSDALTTSDLLGKNGYFVISSSANTKNMKLTISPAYADKNALLDTIKNADEFLDTAEAGSNYGQYSVDAISALNDALKAAEASKTNPDASQADVDAAELELRKALTAAKSSANYEGTVADDKEISISYNNPETKLTVESGVNDVTIKVDSSKESPNIVVTSPDAEIEVEEGTVISDNFKLPLLSGSTPSGSFTLGEAVNTYAQGGSAVSADKPVRIVLKGQKGKQVAYKNAGSYVNITKTLREDSFDAAIDALTGSTKAVKMNIGDDLVIYTTLLSEFVTYEKTTASDDDDYVSNNNNNNNYGGAPAGGGGGFFSTSTTTPSANASNTFVFTDMTNHWAKQDVMSMYNAGIVSGVTATTFEPDRPITRAEFATLIAKGLKLTLETTNDFTDVKADDWFAPYVGAAAKAGIIVGADGKFRPNDTITREEMAVIIVKAYTYKGGKGANGAIDKFTDKAQISAWAKAYVDSAASAGLIAGLGDGTFGPKANATRAQSASLLKRLLSA